MKKYMPWLLSFLITTAATVFYLYQDTADVKQISKSITPPKNTKEIKPQGEVETVKKPIYLGANNEVSENKMAIQYYIPNYQNSFLVPITKVVPFSDKKLLHLMNMLQQPLSKDLGLVTAPPVTKINSITLKQDMIEIDIQPLEARFKSSVAASYMYYASIYHSIKHLPNIRKVQFLVDGKKKNEIFHGTVRMDLPIELIPSPEVYYNYNTLNRRYLVPVPLNKKIIIQNKHAEINQIGELIMKELQKDVVIDSTQLMHVVPKNIKLIKTSFDQDKVHLLFSKEFAEAYGNNYNMKKMMIDAILFSFTSLPGIDYVTLDIQNFSQKEFMNVELKKPLKRYKVINPIS